MRRILPVLALAALCAAFAVPASAATRTVTVKNFAYGPKNLTVRKNTTVVWRFRDSAPHDVKVRTGPQKFKSRVGRRFTYRKKLTRRGTYRMYCTLHTFMTMKVRVR